MDNKNLLKKIFSKAKWYIFAVFAAGFLYYILTGNFGLLKFYELTHKKKELSTRIEALKNEIDSLKKTSQKLDNDPEYIEKVAREKYNMVKKGETVYQMVPADQ